MRNHFLLGPICNHVLRQLETLLQPMKTEKNREKRLRRERERQAERERESKTNHQAVWETHRKCTHLPFLFLLSVEALKRKKIFTFSLTLCLRLCLTGEACDSSARLEEKQKSISTIHPFPLKLIIYPLFQVDCESDFFLFFNSTQFILRVCVWVSESERVSVSVKQVTSSLSARFNWILLVLNVLLMLIGPLFFASRFSASFFALSST